MAAFAIEAWLAELGLASYGPAFVANDIDRATLASLTDADLRELGVVSLGHRKQLLAAIAALAASMPAAAFAPQPAPPDEVEQRQVAVLFADLSGYTRMTQELGAEAMHGLLDQLFRLTDRLIERFGGRVDQHIGDCVMAVFGAPVAHGNDAERAVRAALAIRGEVPALGQRLGQPLAMHIGIASGQIVADLARAGHGQAMTGATLNLASRLTDAAPANGILIAGPIRRLLGERLVCSAPRALAAKGFAEPVEAYELLDLAPTLPTERPLVGRQLELRQIEGLLAACRQTGAGQTILLRGEAGIGKTRLTEECQALARAQGYGCHRSLILDFGMAAGEDPIRLLARGLLDLAPGGPDDAIAAAAAALLGERPDQPALLAHRNDLLGLPQPDALRPLHDAMDQATRERGRQQALAALVEAQTGRQPRLVVVEDLHWANSATLEQLAALAQATASCRLVMMLTSRREGDPIDPAWRARLGPARLLTLDLPPLQPAEAAAMAAAYFEATQALVQRCIERAAGNPLFLDQLLRHAEAHAEASVPGSVQSLVQARLDHLPTADRQALQCAAILGQRFSLAALCHLLEQPAYDPAELVRQFLVRPAGDEFLFVHALIRDAVHDLLLRRRRLALHQRAAEWFASRDLALHAEHLDRAEAPAAAQAYHAAAREALQAYRTEQARHLATRGLALAQGPAERSELACLQGEILLDQGQTGPAGAAFAAALEVAAEDAARARAWRGAAAVKRIIDDLPGALADLDQAEAAAERAGRADELARICGLRGNLCFPLGRLAQCAAEHERSLAYARQAGSAELEAMALGGVGDAAYAQLRLLTGRRTLERCIALCQAHGLARIEAASLPMAALMRFYGGEIAAALEDALAALANAERIGHQRAAIIAHHVVIIGARYLGHAALAQQHGELALLRSRELGATRFEAEGLWFLAMLQHDQGERAAAAATLRAALAISRASGMAYIGPSILGSLIRASDDPAERRAAAAEAEALLAAGAVSHNHLWYPEAVIEAALAEGDWPTVLRHCQMLADSTAAEPLPYVDFLIARGRALAAAATAPADPAALDALRRVRDQAAALGLALALPALEAALAGAD